MRQGCTRVAALAASMIAALAAATGTATAAPPESVPGLPVELALGDSWAAGVRAS